jgi:hypothetical protein
MEPIGGLAVIGLMPKTAIEIEDNQPLLIRASNNLPKALLNSQGHSNDQGTT